MASQPDVLESCLREAAQAARPALEHCIEDAVAALEVAETQSSNVAERDALATAWRQLLKNKAAWSARYPADLRAVFKANVAAAPAQPVAATGKSTPAFLSADSFSLLDDADVSRQIESARLLQQVLALVEQPLAELNSLISSVQGLPNVRPELNPLRPEAFAQTLRALVGSSAAPPDIAALWLSYLADPLGRELHRLYERLVNQLELANVKGVRYRVLPTPAVVASGRSISAASESSGAGIGNRDGNTGGYVSDEPMVPSQYADLSNGDIRDGLFQDFLSDVDVHAQHGLAPAYYATIEEELRALKAASDSALAPLSGSGGAPPPDGQSGPAIDDAQRLVDERSQLSQQVWGAYGRPRERAIVRTQLKKEARRVGQVLGLEVVRKLLNQLGQDPRLLVPVRQAIVALEPALLRLAMVDPHFFSDDGHAGRQLMERVAQRSFKYNDPASAGFLAFFEPVAQAFNQLNGLVIADARPFDSALATLESGWDAQDQREAGNRGKVLQSLRFAEARQTQADEIAADLSTRSDLEKVPGPVLDFLLGPWALAMAHARLTDTRHQLDPQGFGSVVPDLLWSVKRDVTLQRPAKLIEMIPSLLGKLHAGLALLGHDPRESQAFFDDLMKLHQPVLKLRRVKSQRDAQESGALPLEPPAPEEFPATPGQREAKAAAHPWLGREELAAAGFEDTLPTAQGELAPLEEEREDGTLLATSVADSATGLDEADQAAPALATAAAAARSAASQLLLSLRMGQWVDLYSRHHWLRAQLVWANSKGTLFMFVSHGGQPHSMTRRSCERLIRARLLRPVEMHGVVAQALDRLATRSR